MLHCGTPLLLLARAPHPPPLPRPAPLWQADLVHSPHGQRLWHTGVAIEPTSAKTPRTCVSPLKPHRLRLQRAVVAMAEG